MAVELHQLEEKLNALPSEISKQQLVVVEKEKLAEEAKLNYSVALSFSILEAKGTNATTKKSHGVLNSENEARALIEAEYNLKKAEAALKYLENKFISFRKIASLEEAQIKSNISGN
jgi:hypothetical protein